ncbi:hypothetical protein [Edaphosphingomonas haloaromaticamans]|uniref:Uncharacterized protein n=1 Tax=Edaphosphingomonas haloaromaticamans TaxID=653954 RepID=A0A1S1HCH9_9SPHN|nr:hypothetical protein [Sphingomonas haloaromaticamans]OHT19929.1 hypothetical protein BHE75_01922 [Sphingomonas haloaromaticamans]
MSLFAHHGRNTRIGARGRSIAVREIGRRKISVFADAVAEGSSLAAAGRLIGVNQQRSSAIFAQIRRDLGWQTQ